MRPGAGAGAADVVAEKAAALLVIDLQLGMFNGERLPPIHAGDALLGNARTLLLAARRARTRVFHVRHGGGPGHPLEHTTPNWQIHPALATEAGEVVIDKQTPDAFHGTTLHAELGKAGIERLWIVGAQTELCVDTTCRRARSLGYRVTLVSDGHSTWGNGVLEAEQIIAHTNRTLQGWFVETVRTDEVLGRMHGA